ncbi:MAG: hypothetical protein RKO25_13325 [Candidatus Contendobacter sp.]|nr:hypothetical protein [Candidatus Contendobacter sp.]
MHNKDIEGLRPCNTCGHVFSPNAEHFYQKKNGNLSSECRSCFRERSSHNQKKRHHAGGVDYHLAYIVRATRQRARKHKIMYDIDAGFLKILLEAQGGLCAISGIPLTFIKGLGHIPTNASIDRIDPRQGYTRDNVQLLAFQVNTMKSNLSIEQLVFWCKLVLNSQYSTQLHKVT